MILLGCKICDTSSNIFEYILVPEIDQKVFNLYKVITNVGTYQ